MDGWMMAGWCVESDNNWLYRDETLDSVPDLPQTNKTTVKKLPTETFLHTSFPSLDTLIKL